jgi:hypothetical protein
MIDDDDDERPSQAVRRRALTRLEKTIGALVFLAIGGGFVAASDLASPELRLAAGAISAGCSGVIARLFPTGPA